MLRRARSEGRGWVGGARRGGRKGGMRPGETPVPGGFSSERVRGTTALFVLRLRWRPVARRSCANCNVARTTAHMCTQLARTHARKTRTARGGARGNDACSPFLELEARVLTMLAHVRWTRGQNTKLQAYEARCSGSVGRRHRLSRPGTRARRARGACCCLQRGRGGGRRSGPLQRVPRSSTARSRTVRHAQGGSRIASVAETRLT